MSEQGEPQQPRRDERPAGVVDRDAGDAGAREIRHRETQNRETRARNRRTARILLSIALVFFFGVIINRIVAG